MYMAMMESENYTWIAFGSTPNRAKKAIEKKWNDGMRESMTLAELEEYYCIRVIEVVKNKCYVDFE